MNELNKVTRCNINTQKSTHVYIFIKYNSIYDGFEKEKLHGNNFKKRYTKLTIEYYKTLLK